MSEIGANHPSVLDFLAHRDALVAGFEQETIDHGVLLARQGLKSLEFPEPYLAMAQQYMSNTKVWLSDIAPSPDFPSGSQMTVVKKTSERQSPWERIMLLHPDHVEHNHFILRSVLADPEHEALAIEPAVLERLAQMWALFSMIGGIASEASYVVNKYKGNYFPGFNGHSAHFNAHHFLSQVYKDTHPAQGIDVAQDALELSHGLALYLLGGLLRTEPFLFPETRAEAIVDGIMSHEHTQLNQRASTQYLMARAFPHGIEALHERLNTAANQSLSTNTHLGRPTGYAGFFVFDGGE